MTAKSLEEKIREMLKAQEAEDMNLTEFENLILDEMPIE